MSASSHGCATPAAGGVLWRVEDAGVLVALVHRPHYDDWSLPKGKRHPGEQLLLAAVREVGEETGAQVQVGRRLTPVEYRIGPDAIKRVSYWAMRYRGGEHRADDEVDRIRWLSIAEASQRLSYPVDRSVLADFARLPTGTRTLLLIRHAKAGKRSEYRGEDRLRPLDKIGRRHAREAAPLLATFGARRVLAADRVRCEQTVAPLAGLLGLAVESAPEFSDEGFQQDPARALRSVHGVLACTDAAVVCSQGHAVPGLLEALAIPAKAPFSTRKGAVWALSFGACGVLAADYYPHPNA